MRARLHPVLLSLVLSGSTQAQSPAVTGGIVAVQRYNDQYRTTNRSAYGDTWHFTAWDRRGDVYGTFNDGAMGSCSSNIGLVQLVSFDPADVTKTQIAARNCFTLFGGQSAANTNGWTDGAQWKSYDPVSIDGRLYLNVFRQEGPARYWAHESTLIMSADSGKTWLNPAHVADASYCQRNAATCAGGDPPVAGSSAMMWPGDGLNKMTRLSPVQFCQDQSINCPAADDNQTWAYFISIRGDFRFYYLSRVRKSDLPLLDASKWQYFRGGDGADPAAWSSAVDDAIPVANGGAGSGAPNPLGTSHGVAYLRDLDAYLLVSQFPIQPTGPRMSLAWAPHPWGPWRQFYIAPQDYAGVQLPALMLSTYSAVPGNWPRARIVSVGSSNHLSQTNPVENTYSPYFNTLDLQQASNAASRDALGNSRFRLVGSPGAGPQRSEVPMAIRNGLPRRGLASAWEFLNLTGNVGWPNMFVNDLIGGGTCVSHFNNGGNWLAYGTLGKVAWSAAGAVFAGEYGAQCTTWSDYGKYDAPAPLLGDRDWTVILVISPGDPTRKSQTLLWTGSAAGSAGSVWDIGLNGFGEPNATPYLSAGGGLAVRAAEAIGWNKGEFGVLSLTRSAGALDAEHVKMYFNAGALPVTAAGSPPAAAHVNVAPGPLVFACDGYLFPGCGASNGWNAHAFQGTIATALIYDRVLSPTEIAGVYAHLKDALARPPRGLVLP